MFHIKPIPYDESAPTVRALYDDIQHTFGIGFVPLIFQYLAHFEGYFGYMWDKLKKNIENPELINLSYEVTEYSRQAIHDIYTPSLPMRLFMDTIDNPQDIAHIKETIVALERINSKLMLLTLGIRESLKGVLVGVSMLPKYSTDARGLESLFTDISGEARGAGSQIVPTDETKASAARMLVPLFGSGAVVISYYADFFAQIAREVEELVTTQKYLEKRVELEHLGLLLIAKFHHPLGSSYTEIARFAAGKPYFDELLYLLAEAFPSTFPRLVFTSAVMSTLIET